VSICECVYVCMNYNSEFYLIANLTHFVKPLVQNCNSQRRAHTYSHRLSLSLSHIYIKREKERKRQEREIEIVVCYGRIFCKRLNSTLYSTVNYSKSF
jgi:hypothetical protein